MSVERNKIFSGAKGVILGINTGIDISSATKVSIKVLYPNGDIAEWIGSKSNTNNQVINYNLQEIDTVQIGTYGLQAYVEMPNFKHSGEVTNMVVAKPFLILS